MSEAPATTWTSSLEERPEFVHAIGMISIENGNLELALADLLAATLSLSRRIAHAIYFAPRAAALRVEILQAAAKARLAPQGNNGAHALEKQKAAALGVVERLTKRAYTIMQKRHDVMHDAWGISRDSEERPVLRAKPREALTNGASEVRLEDLTNLVRDLRVLITEIQDAEADFRKRPPSMADLSISSTNSGSSARADKDGKAASRKN